MGKQREVSEKEVLALLFQEGRSITDYSLDPGGVVPLFGNPDTGWAALLIEDDSLSKACIEFLLQHGAKRISNKEMGTSPCRITPSY